MLRLVKNVAHLNDYMPAPHSMHSFHFLVIFHRRELSLYDIYHVNNTYTKMFYTSAQTNRDTKRSKMKDLYENAKIIT